MDLLQRIYMLDRAGFPTSILFDLLKGNRAIKSSKGNQEKQIHNAQVLKIVQSIDLLMSRFDARFPLTYILSLHTHVYFLPQKLALISSHPLPTTPLNPHDSDLHNKSIQQHSTNHYWLLYFLDIYPIHHDYTHKHNAIPYYQQYFAG